MRYLTQRIPGIDGSEASLTGYLIENSPEIDHGRKRPAVLIIPGGGYCAVSDREAEPIALTMLGFGLHALVLRYSVNPSRFPTALLEAAEAMRLIREHADEWHIDPHNIAVMGFSAGGHLATCLCTDACVEELQAHGYEPSAVRPDALALGYPVITSGRFAHRGSFNALLGERSGDEELLDRLSLEHHVTPDTPPTFVWHTVTDADVPVDNTLLLVGALRRHQVPVEAHLFPTGKHGLSLGTTETMYRDGSGVEPCVQIWPRLFHDWLRRTFALPA